MPDLYANGKESHDKFFFDADGEFLPGIDQIAYWSASENADLTTTEIPDMPLNSDKYYYYVLRGYESLKDG